MNRSKIGCSQAAQLARLLIQFNDGKEEIVCPLVRMKNYSFQQSLVRDVIVKFHSRKCKADGTVMAN
ncbi:hypothetical protein T4B_135 [Trichinella pseudospiralis]|uniref:Uncharacterized protein n=2 Tax=Trichinella pseudospiralis TaxID=6337 RepID=A0A0V1IQ41_TRIPS|nr:hypothetical protein T4E_2274 [Trichinella pseudospiralis]KRY67591.1 hypothetical protein T4A_9445 [Trichinella pseudospiralis]KRY86142.1 hypothetical protein T4D_7330 [Trichinella pseudospiralis]KRZ24742.1 hypothetical protein T4B_135 [Trichinella pseudospiralis]KRZ30441.1 hypothetical protein T4C_1333 [Trichinella pseudospiralis]